MKQSAGILLYRIRDGVTEFLIAHPGGPIFARKDEGSWSIPKGELNPDEDPLAAAIREFGEELGPAAPELGELQRLTPVMQGSKLVHAFAGQGDFDPGELASNEFEIEWPPRSGQRARFPEIDRVRWVDPSTARAKLTPAQARLIDELVGPEP
jgi:predicted NUDIX family NTP pyrophosphohydrolase